MAVVPIESVSNGCGWGPPSTSPNRGDEAVFHTYSHGQLMGTWTVNFRDACNLHDAGYTGAEVWDSLNGDWFDFFTWTRARLDEKFKEDMHKLCVAKIPVVATDRLAQYEQEARNDCLGTLTGSGWRHILVRALGWHAYRERLDLNVPATGGGSGFSYWYNQESPGDPKWKVTQEVRTVSATWRGGPGHEKLRGQFTGTLISHDEGEVVKGTFTVREAPGFPLVTGEMTWTFLNKDRFKLEYRQANGVTSPPGGIVMVRCC